MDPFPWKSVNLLYTRTYTHGCSQAHSCCSAWGEPCLLNFLYHFLSVKAYSSSYSSGGPCLLPMPAPVCCSGLPQHLMLLWMRLACDFPWIRSHDEAVCLWEQNLRGAGQPVCPTALRTSTVRVSFLHPRHGKGGIWVTEMFENRLGGQALEGKGKYLRLN